MQKIFIAVLAVVFTIMLTGTAMAKGVKPPKSLCVELSPSGDALSLGIKKGTKVLVNGEKVDMYAVQGFLSVYPVTGTGHMDGGTFIFSLHVFNGQSIDGLGVWNDGLEDGVITLGVTDGDGFELRQESLISCTP